MSLQTVVFKSATTPPMSAWACDKVSSLIAFAQSLTASEGAEPYFCVNASVHICVAC